MSHRTRLSLIKFLTLRGLPRRTLEPMDGIELALDVAPKGGYQ